MVVCGTEREREFSGRKCFEVAENSRSFLLKVWGLIRSRSVCLCVRRGVSLESVSLLQRDVNTTIVFAFPFPLQIPGWIHLFFTIKPSVER